MKIYIIITLFVIISLDTAVLGTTFVVVKPVAAASHDDNNNSPDLTYRIDGPPGSGKTMHFNNLDDCHDYIKDHPRSGLSFDACIPD